MFNKEFKLKEYSITLTELILYIGSFAEKEGFFWLSLKTNYNKYFKTHKNYFKNFISVYI